MLECTHFESVDALEIAQTYALKKLICIEYKQNIPFDQSFFLPLLFLETDYRPFLVYSCSQNLIFFNQSHKNYNQNDLNLIYRKNN